MFTGIVEEVGRVLSVRGSGASREISIGAEKILEDIHKGDSIAVNGICLTVTDFGPGWFSADVMHETLDRTSLSQARAGGPVNLERAMRADGRFGGHIVTGHIDGTGTVLRIKPDANAVWYTIQAPPQIMRLIVEKGSVAIDGISLTVAGVSADSFQVSVIPHTRENTALCAKKVRDLVNLENDSIGKYVEKLLTDRGNRNSGLTMEFLTRCGYGGNER